MKVLEVPNVHLGLPRALELLQIIGEPRDSRNGPVLVAPCPVTTVFQRPLERVCFWPERDANPFFHLYESLWMLAGRNDLTPLLRYVKTFGDFSNDGKTLHGAYGARWIQWGHLAEGGGWNQLRFIAEALKKNPEDRRQVLGIWDPDWDLSDQGKDVPCNLTATFQRGSKGALNLVVFCRSNDIVWGTYGANAVHFSFLLEYMALWIGCPVGTYTQVSVNWHGYKKTAQPLMSLANRVDNNPYGEIGSHYAGKVKYVPMTADGDHERVDQNITELLAEADNPEMYQSPLCRGWTRQVPYPWAHEIHCVLKAHHEYTRLKGDPSRFEAAYAALAEGDENVDWNVAARQWLKRREERAK
jgi:hypothetical protein